MTQPPDAMRIDKWLWCARFYKTRSLAVQEIDKGRVKVNGATVKPAREIHAGDSIALLQAGTARTVVVRALSSMRGPAPVAQLLYEETAESLLARTQAAEARCLAPEPADALRQGRPTKRDRRTLDDARKQGWGDRWSASLLDE